MDFFTVSFSLHKLTSIWRNIQHKFFFISSAATSLNALPAMKYLLAYSTLLAVVVARPTTSCGGGGNCGSKSSGGSAGTCNNDQTVVCRGNGVGELLSLGNILPGLLGQSCSGGNVYCCSTDAVDQVRHFQFRISRCSGINLGHFSKG